MLAARIEVYFHDKRVNDDGVGGEACHEEMRKQSTLILLLVMKIE